MKFIYSDWWTRVKNAIVEWVDSETDIRPCYPGNYCVHSAEALDWLITQQLSSIDVNHASKIMYVQGTIRKSKQKRFKGSRTFLKSYQKEENVGGFEFFVIESV